MTERFQVACIQNTAGADPGENIEAVARLVEQAADAGAALVCLPEFFAHLERDEARMRERAAPEDSHPALRRLAGIARARGLWVLLGSIAVTGRGERIRNRSCLLNPDGRVVARYDKIHLFDVDLGDGESYRESRKIEPGNTPTLAHTPWGALGMTVCYDVRFPYLYRLLAQSGALFLSVPAAFAYTTGRAHWHVLLRARAIETGCYVFAPAQCGEHPGGRQTYGHSLIVDPWGEVLADGGEIAGYVMAEVDPARVAETRARLPTLSHDRTLAALEVWRGDTVTGHSA